MVTLGPGIWDPVDRECRTQQTGIQGPALGQGTWDLADRRMIEMSGSGDAAEGSGSRLKIKESGDPVVEVRGTRGSSGREEGTSPDLDIALIGSGD